MAPIDGRDWRDNERERGEIWLKCVLHKRARAGKKSGQLNEDMGVDGAGGVGGGGLTVRGGDIVPCSVAKSCAAVNLTKGSREEDAGLTSK